MPALMHGPNLDPAVRAVSARVQELAENAQLAVYRRADRVFAGLLLFEWVAAVALAVWVSPLAWEGANYHTHPHVLGALLLGGIIISLPLILASRRPAWLSRGTRSPPAR